MCTVTLIPLGNSNFVLTSNRDEAPERETLDPDFYAENGVKLLYPKDALAGGTWIGVSDKNRLICLLNGGFKQHNRLDNYKMSRGIVVRELLISSQVLRTIEDFDFINIEPFTIVIVDWNKSLLFYELVWDGSEKHVTKLSLEPKIWSSSTLYTEEMKQTRLEWFETFKSKNILNPENIFHFHKTAGKGNQDFGVIMDRGFVKTTSITQVEKQDDQIVMQFLNLQNKTKYNTTFIIDENNHE